MDRAYTILYTAALLVIGAALIAALIRTIRGPRMADRLMGVNMAGTLTIMGMLLLSRLLDQDWLLDVALIYAMISFVAVVVLTRIFVTAHMERRGGGK